MSETAELHARLPVYRRRIAEAADVIAAGLSRCRSPYLACSFGKDSAAMLHLVLRQKPDISVRFLKWTNESDYLNDYERVIAEWRSRFDLNLEIVELSRASLDEKVKTRWQAIEQQSDGYFVGFRADESKGRRMTLSANGVIYEKKNSLLRVCPLAWWKTIDVRTYIETNDLPTLAAYAAHGFEARTTARVPRADYGIRSQSLSQLKQRDIGAFNQLKNRFPEIAEYV